MVYDENDSLYWDGAYDWYATPTNILCYFDSNFNTWNKGSYPYTTWTHDHRYWVTATAYDNFGLTDTDQVYFDYCPEQPQP